MRSAKRAIELELREIGELLEKSFFVPHYQRGYRWGKQQVEQLLDDIDAFRAIRAACRDLHFRGFAIGIISREMPEALVAEADFTLNGVNDVERFLRWLSQAVAELS